MGANRLSPYRLLLLESYAALDWWPELEAAITDAFAGARFCDGIDPALPLKHSRSVIKPECTELQHVITLNQANEVQGAIFRLPKSRMPNTYDWEPGFFFTLKTLPVTDRIKIASAIMELTHRLLKELGYKRIVCAMGTVAGARFLAKQFGYVNEPSSSQTNRWVKELLGLPS
jgi:hypothetical protein